MIGYFLKAMARRLRQELPLFVLTLGCVVLGVASVVAIQLVNQSAIAAFGAGMRAVDGEVDLSVVPDGPSLPESVWRIAGSDPGVSMAFPVLDLDVKVEGKGNPFLDLYATDLSLGAPLAAAQKREGERELGSPLVEPGWVALTESVATRLELSLGQAFTVSLGSRHVELRLGMRIADRERTKLPSDRFALMDIASAQELFGRVGELDRIDIRLRDGARADEVIARLTPQLPQGSRAVTPAQRESQAEALLEAFRVNLTALSLVSVLVGTILVFSAVRAQLVRRRSEFGLLRSLGATRFQVLALALGEVLVVALLGCAIGIPAGQFAAMDRVGTVSVTLTNLYLLDAIQSVVTPWWLIPIAIAIGLGGALLAAFAPAIEIATADPRELLSPRAVERKLDRRAPWLALAGVSILLVAFGSWATFAGDSKLIGFALGLAVLLAIPACVPLWFTRVFARVGSGGFGVGYAARSLSRRISTGAIAAAALAIAVSMLFGITMLVGSFRDTVVRWLDSAIRADVYVSTPSMSRSLSDAGIAPEVVARIAADPRVIAIDRQRRTAVWLGDRRTNILAIEPNIPGGEARYPLIDGDPDTVRRALSEPGNCLISEPLSRKLDLAVGDSLTLPGRSAAFPVRIAGIYYDYTSELGVIVLSNLEFARCFGPGDDTSLGIYLKPGTNAENAIDDWRAAIDGSLYFTPNERLRREAMQIFDQTFLVTRLLEATALLVAALGIALGLLILAAERRNEIALYRSIGATPRQVLKLFLGKGLAIGSAGIALGAIGGGLLAFILIRVINRTWFGWTIEATFPWVAMLRQVATILGAVLLASLYPSIQASRESGVELSREQE